MEKAAFSKKKALFVSTLDLSLGKEFVNWYVWSSFVWCWKLDTPESRPEILGKVLKCGAGEGWRSSVRPNMWYSKKCYVECRRIGISYIVMYRWKAKFIGHFLRRDCLLKHVIEGVREVRVEMTVRRGRRLKQLQVPIRKREDPGNWKSKRWITLCGELALDRPMDHSYNRLQDDWLTDWVNEWINEWSIKDTSVKFYGLVLVSLVI